MTTFTEPEKSRDASPRAIGHDHVAPRAHALEPTAITELLDVDPAIGLAEAEVEKRRCEHGANVMPDVRSRRLILMLRDQFLNVIVILLAAAAAISWATGERTEAIAIVVVLVLNAAIGFVTELEAGRALDALRKETQVKATVRRNGKTASVAAEDLVVGDVVFLGAGDRVPADIRVIESASVHAEEAPLTGESKSVFKSSDVVHLDATIADRTSMLFLGTVVTTGRAVGLVTAVGGQTELGKIGALVSAVEDELTPLQITLNAVGRRLAILAIGVGAIVAIAGWLRGDPLWQMAEVGISLAVAAVPEALPAVTTFILAFGVLRMARRNAIVRRLSAVETLGSTTVICSDKTGTLTLNRMTVTEIVLADGRTVTPSTLDADDALTRDAARAAALCNDAKEDSGDPTEKALLGGFQRIDPDGAIARGQFPRVGEIPFDSHTRKMTTIHRTDRGFLFALKGAPGTVLDACTTYGQAPSALTAETREEILKANIRMAARGLRVLALADKVATVTNGDVASRFRFLALVGMVDPPREGVREAIAVARQAGIRIVMLTGDQADTARSIARELALAAGEPEVTHARELTGATPLEFIERVESTDVFARVSPEDKYRIVEALQNAGEVVAVTGDGVNDAPALKKADVGVAMGDRGTEVAKEAADIVLADDNFSTIVVAVEHGRAIYANILKFVQAMFSHNLAEVLVVFVAIVAGMPLPLLPLQILWMNLVTDVFPAFALALEPPQKDVMTLPPRRKEETLLSRSFLVLIGWQGALLATLSLAGFMWALSEYGPGNHAQSVALLSLISVQLAHTVNCRSRTEMSWVGVFSNPHLFFAGGTVIGLHLAATYTNPVARVLGLVRPAPADITIAALGFVTTILVVDLQKLLARRWERASRVPPDDYDLGMPCT